MHENVFLMERLKTGLTQTEICKKINISQPTLSQLENDIYFGKYNFYIIKKLCELYRLDINKIPIGG